MILVHDFTLQTAFVHSAVDSFQPLVDVQQKSLTAETNARFAALHGLPVAPYASRRRPLHFAKPRARHERQ